jgi:DNA-binding transcriptional ArsR family regulator
VSAAKLDRTLAALADPHRRRVIDLLRERPHRAGQLAQAMRLSFPVMSRHLRMLRQGNLVE